MILSTKTAALALFAIALSTTSLSVHAAPDFGIDPWAELAKLEKGDMRLLRQIKLTNGEDLLTFITTNKLTVIHRLSDVACTEKQVNYLLPGCTVTVQITNGRVKNVEVCATLLRWRRVDKNSPFLPANGWARSLNGDRASFFAVLKDNELSCDRRMR